MVATRRSARSNDMLVQVAGVRVQGRAWRAMAATTRGWACPTPARCCRHPGSAGRRRPPSTPHARTRWSGADTRATPARVPSTDAGGQQLVVGGAATHRARRWPQSAATPRRSRSRPSAPAAPTPGPPSRGCTRCRVLRHAPRGDEDRLCHSPGQKVAEQLPLSRLQRQDRCVACQERIGHLERVVAVANERLEGGRHVEDQRGVRHVAEVDDAGNPLVVVEEQVVEGHVVVDELRAKGRQRGDHAPVEALQDAARSSRRSGAFCQRNAARELRQVLLVPPDRSSGGGVEEPSQRADRCGATTSPTCAIAAGSSSAGASERPGRRGSRRTRWVAPSTSAVVTVGPSAPAAPQAPAGRDRPT